MIDYITLSWLLGVITIIEFFIILNLSKQQRVSSISKTIKVKTQPSIEYTLQQTNKWTELYFNNHHHSKKEIGNMYERYIGYLKEQEGYSVDYCGLRLKHKDEGIDLICKKNEEILLIQCKRLSHYKQIHKDIINKLRGSLEEFKVKNNANKIIAEVCSTADFAEDAITAAKIHNIKTSVIAFDNNYPSLKCNISSSGEKHIFAPYHPYYDKIIIDTKLGEFYCHTAEEGFSHGYKPAKIPWKYIWAVKRKIGFVREHR